MMLRGIGQKLVLLSVFFLSACSTSAYFWQATTGHLDVLAKAESIDEVLTRENISDKLRSQLLFVQRARLFSVSELALPDNQSYRTYADLKRPYAVWNVVASQPDTLTLETWCFPFLGCISYKGFYSESAAVELANSLRKQGLDVAVLGVPAYSTLGFTPDPVLNTFINYPAGELARLIFHELAHQVVYIANDTMFNESFASAVEELGVEAWLAQAGHEELKLQYRVFDERRTAFRELLARARVDLELIFENSDALSRQQVLVLKKERLDQLLLDYANLKTSWSGWAGYDRFMSEDLNNAKLGVSGLYTQHVASFKALFSMCGENFKRFYKATEILGDHPFEQREVLLNELSVKAGNKLGNKLGNELGNELRHESSATTPLSFGFTC